MRTVSLSTVAMHAVFVAFFLFCVVPILIVVSSSFTAERSLVIEGFNLWPKSFSLSAYRLVFTHGEALLRAYVVTVDITAIGTLLSVLFSTMTAYTLSRNDFKHRSYFGFYIYFTVLFHGGLVHSYILATRYLHLGNTIWALFLPMLIMPWFIFLMRRFLTDIPVSLIESAKIDGASEYGIFLRIVLPISKPAIAAVSLIMALGYWNSWWLSLLYIENRHLYTLQYLLYIILSNIQALQDAANTSFTVANAMDTPQMSLRMAMALLAAGGNYFLSGTLAALDSENEWYYDRSTSTLYLWAPGGGNPGSRVEYKARNVAFDLTGSAYTELNGIGLFAATIDTGNYGGDAYRVRLTGTGSAVSQVVYGLNPNTNYQFTGSVKAATDGESVTAGVRNFGGTGRSDTVYQSYYRTFDLIFTTGPSTTSAEIYLEKTGGGGDAFGDGFAIKQNGINLVANPGFEAGSLSSWTSAGTATVVANPYADHVVIDGLDADYVAHDTRSDTGYGAQRYSGIILNGTNNVLKKSTVAYSSGNGVNLGGLGNQLVNSIIHDVDYSGTYAAAIQINGADLVSHNTAYGSGRSIFNGFGRNSRIQYNDFGHSGYLSADLGLMYTYGSDGEGTEIHHNYIHDNHAENHAQGIYLDNGSSNYLVYKNKVENIPERGININLPSEFNLIANNDSIVGGSGFAWAYGTDHWGSFLLNNKGALVRMNTESIRAANNENGGIDAGVVVSGVTDGYAGARPISVRSSTDRRHGATTPIWTTRRIRASRRSIRLTGTGSTTAGSSAATWTGRLPAA